MDHLICQLSTVAFHVHYRSNFYPNRAFSVNIFFRSQYYQSSVRQQDRTLRIIKFFILRPQLQEFNEAEMISI